MLFSDVAQIYYVIQQTTGRLEITKLLAALFAQATPHEAEIIANISLGQLASPYKNIQFNVADKMMVRALAQFLSVSPEVIMKDMRKTGDLGLVVSLYEHVNVTHLSVIEVYEALFAMAQRSGEGSQEAKIHDIVTLLQQLDTVSACYVVRIILGKLRLGFSDMTVVDALSWMLVGDKSLRKDIEDAYNRCADIGFLARVTLQGGIAEIKQMEIHIGIPILPAAAERLPTVHAIMEKIGSGVAQSKLDGFRVQIHIDKRPGHEHHVYFFSRNLLDMSAMFPELTHACMQLDVKTLICEGEAIAYDPNTESFLPFQETVKRRRKHDIEAIADEFPLKVILFDILYLNGKELIELPHHDRRQKLLHVLHSYRGNSIKIVDEFPVYTASELEAYFAQNIAAGLEGIIVKKDDAVYQPGKRNFNWIKLKRVHEGHLDDTIDCVILGYYIGEGKRLTFGIGAFLVGVYNVQDDCFETIAKVGTGLTDEQWKELKKICDVLAIRKKPHNVVCPKDLTPDVWLSPHAVCAILADEITLSPLHTAGKAEKKLGFALRFPRMMGFRPDKNAPETTTVDEIAQMYAQQYKK